METCNHSGVSLMKEESPVRRYLLHRVFDGKPDLGQ
jgi:hypothetical protein